MNSAEAIDRLNALIYGAGDAALKEDLRAVRRVLLNLLADERDHYERGYAAGVEHGYDEATAGSPDDGDEEATEEG